MTEEKPWREDETIAMVITCPYLHIKTQGTDIQFADDVNFDAWPRGKIIEPGDDTLFMVTPASSWNGIQRGLQEVVADEKVLNRFSHGRSYQIPTEHLIWKHFPEKGFKLMIKMTMELDPETYDFRNTIRMGQDILNIDTYPMVVITRAAWNTYQLLIDELGIRDHLRKSRPMGFPIRPKDAFRITHAKFEDLKPPH